MQNIHTSINGLINKLFTKYGADKARSIMSSTYGRNLSEQELYQAINMDNQGKAEHPADIKPGQSELEFDLKYLRTKWVQLRDSIAGVDGRTALAKRTKAMMASVVDDGISIKSQMQGA